MNAKEDLLLRIEGAIYFRSQKEVEYPEDSRNHQSVVELQQLYKHVRALSVDHSLLVNWEESSKLAPDDLGALIAETDVFGRYGFDGAEDPEDFCNQLSETMGRFIQDRR